MSPSVMLRFSRVRRRRRTLSLQAMAKKKSKKARSKSYSTLDQHRRRGSVLLPPLATLPNLHHASWIKDRLPELAWCALLVTHLGQKKALDVIRRAIVASRPLLAETEGNLDLGLTGLIALPDAARDVLLGEVTSDPLARVALKPLLLFGSLPGRDHWAALLEEPSDEDWDKLAFAVGHVFDHQSQEATDCRWARVIFKAVNGRIVLPANAQDLARELLEYPNYGDQRKVRPTIRSMEMAFSTGPDVPATEWHGAFWNECWRSTPCRPSSIAVAEPIERPGTTIQRIQQVVEALKAHQRATTIGTDVNAKHDAVFGSAAYALEVMWELLRVGNATSILARTGLRAILEVYITLSYLLAKDAPDLWSAFRTYGAGQAKLAFMKRDAEEALKHGFVSLDLLSMIANEDQSLELLPIDVGHWGDSNLRQMSEDAQVKHVYDQFYPWTSAFVHANWAALRSSSFDVCLNPLHRAHRVLRSDPAVLADVVPDATELLDRILGHVHAAYPHFAERLAVS